MKCVRCGAEFFSEQDVSICRECIEKARRCNHYGLIQGNKPFINPDIVRKIAEGMESELIANNGVLFHSAAIQYIWDRWGEGCVYFSNNDSLGIAKPILEEFARRTEGEVVWSKSECCWRLSLGDEGQDSRLVD